MRRTLYAAMLFLGAFLAACGPLLGQAMRVADGVKEFEVRHGTLEALGQRQTALVLGPFAKTPEAFYIARGEDAAGFAEELERQKVLQAVVHVQPMGTAVDVDAVRALSPAQLREHFKLADAPGRIVFGTIVKRQTLIAPTRGVIMRVTYRLEFYDPNTRDSTVIVIAVRDLAERCIPLAVEELRRRLDANSG